MIFHIESLVKNVLETFEYLPDNIWSHVCPTLTVNKKIGSSKNSNVVIVVLSTADRLLYMADIGFK